MKIAFIDKDHSDYALHNLKYDNLDLDITLMELNKLKSFNNYNYIFLLENGILYLRDLFTNIPAVTMDFCGGKMKSRMLSSGHKNELIKALSIKNNLKIRILDTTSGFGKDSFILASKGAKVIMLEQNPLIFNITNNALQRAAKNSDIKYIVSNIHIYNIEASEFLESYCDEPFDCIYLDPMFPKRNKNALVKKEMQMFHKLAYYGNNKELFQLAILKAKHKVVVKRMLHDEVLIPLKPSYQILGKNIRFDVYVK